MTISDRLRQRMEFQGWNVSQLRERVLAIAPGESRGTSYASVHAYVNGKGPEPPLSFLRPAAEVLGVRLAWLAAGDEPPTATDVQTSQLAGMRQFDEAIEAMRERVQAALEAGLGRKPEGVAYHALLALGAGLQRAADQRETTAAEDYEWIASAVSAPLLYLGFYPESMPAAAFQHYVATSAEALRYLIAETEKQA